PLIAIERDSWKVDSGYLFSDFSLAQIPYKPSPVIHSLRHKPGVYRERKMGAVCSFKIILCWQGDLTFNARIFLDNPRQLSVI
ncbi:MAG: hypothetical protein WC342_10875, partial [Methanoregula sp.]